MSPLNHCSVDAAQMSTSKRRGEQDGFIQVVDGRKQAAAMKVAPHP